MLKTELEIRNNANICISHSIFFNIYAGIFNKLPLSTFSYVCFIQIFFTEKMLLRSGLIKLFGYRPAKRKIFTVEGLKKTWEVSHINATHVDQSLIWGKY